MSKYRSIHAEATQTGVRLVWSQWSTLGAGGLPENSVKPRSIIDPEALLLFSFELAEEERRLQDFTAWMAEVGSDLLSVQRMKKLVPSFPTEGGRRLASFAAQAVDAGDRRWRRYANGHKPARTPRPDKGAKEPRLSHRPALMMRLRAGIGVGVKSDLLTYLLGSGNQSKSVREITDAIQYSRVAVQEAAKDMGRAKLLRKDASSSTRRYYAPVEAWMSLLADSTPSDAQKDAPPWRHWSSIFGFLAATMAWAEKMEREGKSEYLASSAARDIVRDFAAGFSENRISVPDPSNYAGEEYLAGYQQTVSAVSDWSTSHL